MNTFLVGFAKQNVNPPLGIGISGYYVPRFAKGILDDIDVRVLALSKNEKKILLISVPVCGVHDTFLACAYKKIRQKTNVKEDSIFISATHTHTGPLINPVPIFFEADETTINIYAEFLAERLADTAKLALDDLKPAKMGFATGRAPERVAYIRRYKMKDGSTYTCPPINDPNIDYPIGSLDQRVHILRFDRQDTPSIVFVNYGLHTDTIGGELISPDWPGWMYSTIEKALDGTQCIFFNGSEGDVGSTHVFPDGGDMNDTEISFDNEMKSPGMARFIGRAIAGTVLQVYDKVHYIEVDKINMIKKHISIPANVPDKKDLPLAHKYAELHNAGREDEIPFKAMQLTTVVAEALRMCRLENGPSKFNLCLTGVQIGNVALLGIPGEPFTDIGVGIKETKGWSMIMPCALTNGDAGYFPMKTAYDEGGYEARTSQYKSGVAEKIIVNAKALLEELIK